MPFRACRFGGQWALSFLRCALVLHARGFVVTPFLSVSFLVPRIYLFRNRMRGPFRFARLRSRSRWELYFLDGRLVTAPLDCVAQPAADLACTLLTAASNCRMHHRSE